MSSLKAPDPLLLPPGQERTKLLLEEIQRLMKEGEEVLALRKAGHCAAALEKIERSYLVFREVFGESHVGTLSVLGVMSDTLGELGPCRGSCSYGTRVQTAM
jgi:hypothetical protein